MKPDMKPTLADRFLARKWSKSVAIHPNAYARIQQGVRAAHRFVLDEDACRRVAKVVMDIPGLLVREHQFARAPYDVTWIEWPSWHYWNEFRLASPDLYAAAGDYGNPDTADYEVGFLIDNGRINVISCGRGPGGINGGNTPELTALQYHIHRIWEQDEIREFTRRLTQLTRYQRFMIKHVEAFLWGSTWGDLTEDERASVTYLNTAEFLPFRPDLAKETMEDGAMAGTVRAAVGEFRTVIALLLILNRPQLVTYKQVPFRGRTFSRGKQLPLLSHNKVTITIDPSPVLRLIGTERGNSVPLQRHEVKGHYRENEEARMYRRIAGCIHEYQPADADWEPWPEAAPDQVKHWVCSQCSGKRWWVKDYKRGDEDIGHLHHDQYDVKGSHRHGSRRSPPHNRPTQEPDARSD